MTCELPSVKSWHRTAAGLRRGGIKGHYVAVLAFLVITAVTIAYALLTWWLHRIEDDEDLP